MSCADGAKEVPNEQFSDSLDSKIAISAADGHIS
jgi:hypothetical protein